MGEKERLDWRKSYNWLCLSLLLVSQGGGGSGRGKA